MTKTWPGTQPFGECVMHPMDQGPQPAFLGMALTSICICVVVGNLTSTDLQMLEW